MIYALTPEQHAQIVDALHIDAAEARLDEALVMLKGLKSVEPCAYARFADNKNIRFWTHHPEEAPQVPDLMPLYALEAK